MEFIRMMKFKANVELTIETTDNGKSCSKTCGYRRLALEYGGEPYTHIIKDTCGVLGLRTDVVDGLRTEACQAIFKIGEKDEKPKKNAKDGAGSEASGVHDQAVLPSS